MQIHYMGLWNPGVEVGILESGCTQYWLVNLEREIESPERWLAILSEEEREVAFRFRLREDRIRYLTSHAVLRLLLGEYLKVEPRTIAIKPGPWGKPLPIAETGLHFSLSRSKDRAVLAFARNHQLGIDIEALRVVEEANDIVNSQFSECEKLEYSNLAPAERADAFIAAWTRKEAYVKATGKGLGVTALNSFSVSMHPYTPARLLKVEGDPAEAGRWQLYDLPVEAGYRCTLATETQA